MTTPPPEAPRHHFDFGELMRVASRRRWLLITPWAAALALGITAAFVLKPVYFSSTTLMLEHATQLSGPLGGMVGGTDNSDQQAEVMRDQVQSSLFLRSVLTATGLKSDPATRAWALKQGGHIPGASEDESIETFLIDYLREAITIRRQRGNIFVVTVGDYSAVRARKLTEAVANEFVQSSKAAQLEAVRATQEFSVEQEQIYKRRLEESESKLEAARRASVATQLSGSVVNPNNFQTARTLTDQAVSDLDEQRQLIARLRSEFPKEIRENDPAQLSSANTSRLIAQISSLEKQLATVLLGVSNDGGGSTRLDISRKIAELEAELTTNAARALPTLSQDSRDLLVRYRLAQADLEAKLTRKEFLTEELNTYEKRAVSGPDQDLAITRLQQQADNDRALYNSFLQQSAASQISEAFNNAKVGGHFGVLEPANLPRVPGKPNRPVLIILSLLVGGMIGVGSILFVEQHDQSMKNAEEVESLLGLPVVGAIPRVDELQRSARRPRSAAGANPVGPGTMPRDRGLLHRLKVESPLGLEFRRIYLNLARTRGRALPRTVVVTSATRGEGKTTSVACLALTLARELRDKLLLVDFDLRSPALHRALGLPGASWGLAQMLQHRNFDERFIRSTVQPGLDFLPAGRSERPASELIDTASVEWFLEEATSRYPLVLIDAAPNLAVPDALILGRAVEGVLYVIKAGSTVRKAAEYGVKVQREARDNLLGVLLNDVGEILPQYYGYRANTYGYSSEAAGGGDR